MNENKMPEELEAKRDELAQFVHKYHLTSAECYFKQGFDKCFGLMLERQKELIIKSLLMHQARESKLKAQIGIALYVLNDYAKSQQHGSSARVALERIEEIGK